jgi:hypothetical protein
MLLDAVFRANPCYELVSLEQLPPHQQELLSDLRDRPDFSGVLRPRESGSGTVKAVSHEAAQLYAGLAQPAQLPIEVRASLSDEGAADIVALVLDGVLEIARNGEEDFVSGVDAYGLLYGQIPLTAAQSVTARLSQRRCATRRRWRSPTRRGSRHGSTCTTTSPPMPAGAGPYQRVRL